MASDPAAGHAPQPAPTPTPAPAAPDPAPLKGGYRIWPADANGNLVNADRIADGTPDPSARDAVDLYFGILSGPPPKEQLDLQTAIDETLSVVRTLYLTESGLPLPAFRSYYTRLFLIAQLGLENNAMPEVARVALDRVVADLINAEGTQIKNARLMHLGTRALSLAGIFLLLYLVISLLAGSPALFDAIHVEPLVAQSFMMLWVGCLGGVWLSYAIRTTTFTLRDLVATDADRLLPFTRLVFAGILTTILGLLLATGFVDAEIGAKSLSNFVRDPMLALLLGLFCGISELLLPTMIGKRAQDWMGKLK